MAWGLAARGIGWGVSRLSGLFARSGGAAAKAAAQGADDAARVAVGAVDDVAAAGVKAGAAPLSRGQITRLQLRNLALIGAGGTGVYYGGIYANNALDGAPLNAAIDGINAVFGRETAEQILGFYEGITAEEAAFYEGGAKHVVINNDMVTEEDLSDPRIAHLVRGVALYATQGKIAAGMHLSGTPAGSQLLDAYGKTEERMIAEAKANGTEPPSNIDVAREAFVQVRDELREERRLAAARQTQLAAAGDGSALAAAAVADGGFDVTTLKGVRLSAVFDEVAENSWWMKAGSSIAKLFDTISFGLFDAQENFQRYALTQADTKAVYNAFRKSADQGIVVANGGDRFELTRRPGLHAEPT